MKKRLITSEPEKLGIPYTVIREIEGQGFEVEFDFPERKPVESKAEKYLKKIAAHFDIDLEDEQ